MKPLGYPSQTDIELPLLKVLVRQGGSICLSSQGEQIADELAEHFKLTAEQRRYSSPELNSRDHNQWLNDIQYVRLKLVQKGEMLKEVRDWWKISDLGRQRVEADPKFQAEKQAKQNERVANTVAADCDALYADQEDQGYATPDRSPTYYERNPSLRKEAIRIHGTSCMICGLNFGEFYGDWGELYIEVHHIVPISEVAESTNTDPEHDMIVVCANCHRMIHRKRRKALHPDQLRIRILPAKSEYGLPRDLPSEK